MEQRDSAETVVRVYHRRNQSKSSEWPRDYMMVALMCVEATELPAQLDEALQRTRHGDRRWFHRTGILATPVARRSTSRGDIAVFHGKIAYRYLGARWEKLTRASLTYSVPASAVYAEVS